MLLKNHTLSPSLSTLSDREERNAAVGQSCAADQTCQEYHHPAAYTIAQFVHAFGISRAHLYALIRRGEGPKTFTVGRRRLISGLSAAAWIRRKEALAAAQLTPGAER
jgi:predicted DNA-binding transcriptional regulator AlpA